MTDEEAGRRRIEEQARDEDATLEGRPHRSGGEGLDVVDPADPLAQARSQAVADNTNRDEGDLRSGDIPGNTPAMEEWEREKRMGER
jgi:hypothetical protein